MLSFKIVETSAHIEQSPFISYREDDYMIYDHLGQQYIFEAWS